MNLCYEFIKLTFIQWSTGLPDVEPLFKNESQGELKYESLLFTGAGGNTCHALRGHTGRSSKNTEKQDLGTHACISSMGGEFWGSSLRPDWLVQTKGWGMLSSVGILSRDHRKGRH